MNITLGWKSLTSLFIVAFLFFLCRSIPASLVTNQLTLPKNVSVSGIRGTIWQAEIEQLSIEQINIAHINAKMNFSSLFTLSPQVYITFGGARFDGPEGYATFTTNGNSTELTNVKVTIAANEIAQKLHLPISVNAGGAVELTASDFQTGTQLCENLTGQVTWQKPRVEALKQSVEINTLTAKLSCAQGAIAAKISKPNDLGIDFTAYIRGNGQISGNGYLLPDANFPAVLRDALPFLGRADGQGRYRLQLP
jgi:general secretion pathway protein N